MNKTLNFPLIWRVGTQAYFKINLEYNVNVCVPAVARCG